MSSSTPFTHVYRSLLREVRLAARQPRAARSPLVPTHLRALLTSPITSPSSAPDMGAAEAQRRAAQEITDFLRSTRIHGELLKRYNPTADMSEEERVKATARRVGLDTPVGYKGE